MMLIITQKQLVVFLFRQMMMENAGHGVHKPQDFRLVYTGNQRAQQLLPAEKAQEQSKRPFISRPVQAKANLIKASVRRRIHPASTFQKTLRLLGPSYSQKKICCHVPSRSSPLVMITVTELPVSVAMAWAGELPSAWRQG